MQPGEVSKIRNILVNENQTRRSYAWVNQFYAFWLLNSPAQSLTAGPTKNGRQVTRKRTSRPKCKEQGAKSANGARDSLARLTDIFYPLLSDTSTPVKLYRRTHQILTSQCLEPYEFSIEEGNGDGGKVAVLEPKILGVNEQRALKKLKSQFMLSAGDEKKAATTDSPRADPNKLNGKFKVEKGNFPLKRAETPEDATRLNLPLLFDPGTPAAIPRSEDYASELPLACFDVYVLDIPQAKSANSPCDQSDIPLADLEMSASTIRHSQNSENKPLQTISEFYRSLISLCAPGPDPLDLLFPRREQQASQKVTKRAK